MMNSSSNNNEVELSSFQMDYRPVNIRTNKEWNDSISIQTRYQQRQKTLWVQGAAVAAVVLLLLAVFSHSSSSSTPSSSDSNNNAAVDNRLHNELFKLAPEDESAKAHFGLSIVILNQGDIFIASPAASIGATKYVGGIYGFDSATKKILQKIPSPETTERAFFGNAMDQDGDLLVVGAPGISKVFCYSTTDFSLQATIASNATRISEVGDNFGGAVAIHESTLVVGANLADGERMETSFGRIYVYERSADGTSFTEIQSFESPNPQKGEMFGGTIALHGDYLVVGDFLRSTDEGENSGVVYIYKRGTDKQFELLQTLKAADGGATHEGFGASVAISDTILVVGLNDREGRVIRSLNGGAYVYRKYDDEWKFESLLLAHDQAIMNGQFGGGVAVEEETIVVGSQEMDEEHAGKVYVFEKNPVTAKWTDVAELAPSDASEGHHFGRIVTIRDRKVVVGAFNDGSIKNEGGSAYVFDITK